jgi:hypothetical protein
MKPTFRFRLLFSALMSLLMSALMTGWVTWLNLGLVPDFLQRWCHSFGSAWPAAFVVVLVAAPAVQRASQSLLQRWQA